MRKSVTLIFENGEHDGIIELSIKKSSFKIMSLSKDDYIENKIDLRKDLDNLGVYILLGEKNIYIGESEKLSTRISQHTKDNKKEFNRIIAIIFKDEYLNSSHAKWLERELCLKIKDYHNLSNVVEPTKKYIHKDEEYDMKTVLEEVLFSLPLINFPYPLNNIVKESAKLSTKLNSTSLFFPIVLNIKEKNIDTSVVVDHNKMTIKKGSIMKLKNDESMIKTSKEIKDRLIKEKIIQVLSGGNSYIFNSNFEMKSLNSIAQLICGRSVNAWVTFRFENSEKIDTKREELSKLLNTQC